MTEIVHIKISGYWRERHSPGLPNCSGIFFVYGARYNRELNHLSLRELIYIGKAQNIRQRVNSHPRRAQWQRHLKSGFELCFSTAPVSSEKVTRVRDAYVQWHQPLGNSKISRNYYAVPTKIVASGVTHLLQPVFTIKAKYALNFSVN